MPDTIDQLTPLLMPLLYHTVTPEQAQRMEQVRVSYLTTATVLHTFCPAGRSRGLALTELENSCMRAIQAIAMEGTPQIPASFAAYLQDVSEDATNAVQKD